MRTGKVHTAAAAAGLTALLVLHLGAADAAGPASVTARALVVSDQARRYLALAYGSSPTEFMGCMIGQVHGRVVFVQRIAPADVDPAHSTQTHVLPRQTCEQAGWQGTDGRGSAPGKPSAHRLSAAGPGRMKAVIDRHSRTKRS